MIVTERSVVCGEKVCGQGQEKGIMKEHKETSWGDVYVHYLNYADGFMGVHV